MIKKHINLLVTGSSQAAKAIDLYNLLIKDYDVNVVLTENAHHFVQFDKSIKVYTSMFDEAPYQPGDEVEHIAFRTNVDLNVVYPTTVDVIAKIAVGMASDLVTTIIAISNATVPTLVFPGYHTHFDKSPFLIRNKQIIYETNPLIKVYDTMYGVFPDGEVGTGWTYSPEDAFEEIKRALNN